MTEINFRAKALSGLVWRLAHDCIGMYPMSITGKGGYEKRTERMEGWNECASAFVDKAVAISRWLKGLPADYKQMVEDFLLQDVIDLTVADDDSISMNVNCNDVFFWGCSDCEDLELADLPALQSAIAEARAAGAETSGELLWIARKRGERPQGAFYAYVAPGLGKLFDTCGPFRPSQMGNPVASSFEEGEKYREKKRASR